MAIVTKPVILDETGKGIRDALDSASASILASITDGFNKDGTLQEVVDARGEFTSLGQRLTYEKEKTSQLEQELEETLQDVKDYVDDAADKILADITDEFNIDGTLQEVVDARGDFVSLGQRLDNDDERIGVLEKTTKELEYWKTTNNALPKVTGEGTDITLNNTADTPLTLGFKASESIQNTTTGKNLFDGEYENGGYNIYTGVKENNSAQYRNKNFINVKPSTEYIFSINGIPITEQPRYFFYDENKNFISSLVTSNTFTTPNNCYFLNWHSSGLKTNYPDGISNAQIEEGNTATPFEPYTNGPTPNPDYPQEIHTVNKDNTIVVENMNLFDKDHANILNATFFETKTLASSANGKTLYISCKPNTTYIISKISSQRFRVLTTEEEPDIGVIGIQYMAGFTETTQAITTDNNANYLCVYYYLNGTDTISEQSVLDSIQIEIGSQATTYIEHKGQIYSINLGVVNLFDKDNQDFKEGYILNDNGEEQTSNISKYSLNFTEVKPNTTYTLQGSLFATGNSMRLYLYDENKDFISRTTNIGSGSLPYTFTTNSSTYYLRFQVGMSGYDGDTVQLEKGTIAHSYSPYGQEPIEMCNINNYADEFFKNVPECEYYDNTLEKGKWYKYARIGKIILDGSNDENWQNLNLTFYLQYNFSKTLNSLCTHFIKQPDNRWVSSDETYRGKFSMSNIDNQLKFMSTDENINTLDLWKAWLSSNNVTVRYATNTPTKTLLPDTLQTQLDDTSYAMAYQDQTNIPQVNEDRPFIISASTIKDMKTLEDRITALENI